jgi:hypothetical protein
MAHRARAHVGAGVAKCPITLGGGHPPLPLDGRVTGKIAVDVMGGVTRFRGEFATGETYPKRSMGIGAGPRLGLRG